MWGTGRLCQQGIVLRGLCPEQWQQQAGASTWFAGPVLHRQLVFQTLHLQEGVPQ